jgi:protein-S-isoprenylcysteine O-methyltransferase Ste14
MPALWIALLFGSAGTLRWLRGWICLAAYIICMSVVGILMRRSNPELEQERSKWKRDDTKKFDKTFLALFIPLTFVQVVVAGFDVVRFGWTRMPFEAVYPGVIIFAAANALIGWTLAVNRHAETTVRIQSDRAHTVITSGPYRIVRHPMYLGTLFMYPATALILGSLWALAVSAIMALLLIWRTAMEDLTLRDELPGYEEFTRTTRYRLLPGIW